MRRLIVRLVDSPDPQALDAALAWLYGFVRPHRLAIAGLLGLSVDNDQAEYARELITAYNAALPLPGDEPESFPGTLVC